MNNSIMPQLRILTTDFCDSKCIYCRPSGEGNLQSSRKRSLSLDVAKKVADIYQKQGGTEIKITGGDPVYWPCLVEYVSYLKEELKFLKVEVITRSANVKKVIDDLVTAGVDVLNFSLDTVNPDTYKYITGKNDFEEYLDTIRLCAKKVFCKINSVIMANVNENDWNALIEFSGNSGIKQLKLLDFIDDLSGDLNTMDDMQNYFISFDVICNQLRIRYGREKIVFQGGLGHPMNLFLLPNGLEVICKNSQNGAWYSQDCSSCRYFPCHDALMALRVTPCNSFQLCLLNQEKHWYFSEHDIEEKFKDILAIYQNAFFVGGNRHEGYCFVSSSN